MRRRAPFALTRDAMRCDAMCNVMACELTMYAFRWRMKKKRREASGWQTDRIILLAGTPCFRCFPLSFAPIIVVRWHWWLCETALHLLSLTLSISLARSSILSKYCRILHMNRIMQTFNRIYEYGWECVYAKCHIWLGIYTEAAHNLLRKYQSFALNGHGKQKTHKL